jgi:hypothetical protein
MGNNMSNLSKEKMESLLAKITWIQEILNATQQQINDRQVANILSGVEFILDSVSTDAEVLYNTLK